MLSLIILFFWHIMSSWTLRFFVRTCVEEWFRIAFFFLTYHVILNLIQDLTFIFFKKDFDSFFLSLLYFYFFHKNYYHFTKGKEPARSPKPAVSFPLNPFLIGHGLGVYPKNPPTSKVSSVSYEQICVAIFFYHIMSSWTLRFFVRTCFEEWFRISL